MRNGLTEIIQFKSITRKKRSKYKRLSRFFDREHIDI